MTKTTKTSSSKTKSPKMKSKNRRETSEHRQDSRLAHNTLVAIEEQNTRIEALSKLPRNSDMTPQSTLAPVKKEAITGTNSLEEDIKKWLSKESREVQTVYNSLSDHQKTFVGHTRPNLRWPTIQSFAEGNARVKRGDKLNSNS